MASYSSWMSSLVSCIAELPPLCLPRGQTVRHILNRIGECIVSADPGAVQADTDRRNLSYLTSSTMMPPHIALLVSRQRKGFQARPAHRRSWPDEAGLASQ